VIAANVPGATLTVLEPGAHLLNVERPDEITASILAALPIDPSTRHG
jgi:pimeloyl-ACP methyl ester carboxylesterase